jgi:hypothetical protein
MSFVTPMRVSHLDKCAARAPLSRLTRFQSQRAAVLTVKHRLVAENLSPCQPTTRQRVGALSSASLSSLSAHQQSLDQSLPILSSLKSGSREARLLFQRFSGLQQPYTQPTALLATAQSVALAGSSHKIGEDWSFRASKAA